MNEFEILREYINHTREIIGPMFSGLADIGDEYAIEEAGKALARIEKEYKTIPFNLMNNLIEIEEMSFSSEEDGIKLIEQYGYKIK